MYWDVKLVKPLSGYRIYVEIENQQKGVFDLKPYLDKGVFRELQNIHYFKVQQFRRFGINLKIVFSLNI